MIVPFTKSSEKRVTAILSPREKDLFFEQLNTDYKIRFEFLYRTAMRLREVEYFSEHHEIYKPDNGLIALPHVEGMGKHMCPITSRNILLSPRGITAVEDFIRHKTKIPKYQSMDDVCKRAARDADIKPDGIVAKMFRKMAVSHLMTVFPHEQTKISMSVGHDYNTMQSYYLIYGWKKDDIVKMRDEWALWGEAV